MHDLKGEISADCACVAAGIDDRDHVDVGAPVVVRLGGIGLVAGARAVEPDGEKVVAELRFEQVDDPLDRPALGVVERRGGERAYVEGVLRATARRLRG